MDKRNINLVSVGKLGTENYFAKFEVIGLTPEKIKLFKAHADEFGEQRQATIEIAGNKVFMTEVYTSETMESTYSFLLPMFEAGTVPKRVAPDVLSREMDLAIMEDDVSCAVLYATMTPEEIENHYALIKNSLNEFKDDNGCVVTKTGETKLLSEVVDEDLPITVGDTTLTEVDPHIDLKDILNLSVAEGK